MQLKELESEISLALQELRGCRADHAHSPNAETTRCVEYAELRLNRLLERRYVEGGVLPPTPALVVNRTGRDIQVKGTS